MAYLGNQRLPGLHPVTNGIGGTTPRVRHYQVSSTYATTISEGSIVIKDNLGINMDTSSGTATAYNLIVGVAAHNVAATPGADTTIAVYDDPAQEYTIVATDSNTSVWTTPTTTALIEYVGQFTGLVSNTHNATLGQSKALVDFYASTITSVHTTSLPLQIVSVQPSVGNTRSSSYYEVRVKITDAAHMFGIATGTATVAT